MATRKKTAGKNHASVELLNKLKFVAQIQKKDDGYSSHCIIRNKMICATDGVFTMGVPIDEDIQACPHSHSLIAALSKCGEHVSIAMDKNGVSVNSGKLTVKIAALDITLMPPVEPDHILVQSNAGPNPVDLNRLKQGFEVVGVLAKEGDLMLHKATLLLEAYIVSGTNGTAAMQYHHGIDLPPDLVIPKKFADLVTKNPNPVVGFGWSRNKSITFWFDDGSFIKTQLQRGQWPNVGMLFDRNSEPIDLPEGFAEAVTTVSSFSKTELIEFGNGVITSDIDGKNLASFEVQNLPVGRIFNGKTLTAMLPNIQSADFFTYDDRVMVFGCDGNMRGALMTVKRV